MVPVNSARSLEEALDRMTDALQRGAITGLGDLAREIAAACDTLPPKDAARAEGLRRRAARNAVCLQAAARGVRAAVARIAGLTGDAAALSTYGADGRKVRVGSQMSRHSSRL